nr:MAG TPA: hypothetical protein [Caudoviricetes sp.]
MKGIIDITIKRKDGTTEHRHEHNVVFDLPALILKRRLEMPDWVHLLCGNSMDPALSSTSLRDYSYFGLSEEEFSLTQPEYRPFALVGVEKNATNWYQSVPSKVLSGKSLTLQESWTIQTPITLKGIAVHPKDMTNIFYNVSDHPHWNDGMLYCRKITGSSSSETRYQKADFSMGIFSYNNSYANGFASSSDDRTHCSIGCMPYKLANPNERIAFVDTAVKRTSNIVYNANAGVAIYKYPDDNTLLRSFKFSQFTGFSIHSNNPSYNEVFVMSTGTKNYLFQVIMTSPGSSSLIKSFNAWQIPDSALAENETVAPVKTDFLSDFWPTTNGYSYSPTIIIGNYFLMFGLLFKVDDSLTVTQYHGASNILNSSPNFSNLSLSDSGITQTLPTGSYSYYWATSYAAFNTAFYNLTAANFSTPITLAEGDVLTVSYKIEVA